MDYKFAVAKISDIDTLLDEDNIQKFYGLLNRISEEREAIGKSDNHYIVVNLDEPYAGDVIEILKRNGHWDSTVSGRSTKTISELVEAAHKNAESKGWWVRNPSFGETIALIHSEASEALEDFRNGKQPTEMWYEAKNFDGQIIERYTMLDADWKPCGIPSELADIVIRVMDVCGHYGIDLEKAIQEKMAYNATRPQRHGGKVL
ncbi:hypothetical protein P9222_00980 [Paenibacillus amylolyticus]|nr:hypothetical protein [Paenibacillus amylolyticus]WFR63054.1 hypothetical protein P9222_00980 [Paenibacillus amylolyticus]